MPNLRQTAYKVWISDLLNGKYVRQEGEWDPNYIQVHDLKVSRANIVAGVIEKYVSDNADYGFLSVDDSTGVIRVKVWKEDVKLIENIQVGDLVLIIGRPREMNSEIYVMAEIIKMIENKEWANVRKEELKKRFGVAVRAETVGDKAVEEEQIEHATTSDRQKVLSIIEKSDDISFDEIVDVTKINQDEVSKIVKELLQEGEIYQPRAGIFKIV